MKDQTSISLDSEVLKRAKKEAKTNRRTLSGQLEVWLLPILFNDKERASMERQIKEQG